MLAEIFKLLDSTITRIILTIQLITAVGALLRGELRWFLGVLLSVAVLLIIVVAVHIISARHPDAILLPGDIEQVFPRYKEQLRALAFFVVVIGMMFLVVLVEEIASISTPQMTDALVSTPAPTRYDAIQPTATEESILVPTPTPTPSPEPPELWHVIQDGENPWCLSEKYYGDGEYFLAICWYNRQLGRLGENCEQLSVGSVLAIPYDADTPYHQHPDPSSHPGRRGVDYFCQDTDWEMFSVGAPLNP